MKIIAFIDDDSIAEPTWLSRLTAPFAIERAISSAGGLAWDEVDTTLMLRRRPGIFACGEMLDWEAPTGGYLLQACFATGHAAGQAAAAFVR